MPAGSVLATSTFTVSTRGTVNDDTRVAQGARVVLVSLDWIREGDPRTSLGTASITAALRSANVDVRLVSAPVNAADFDLARTIAEVVAVVRSSGPRTLVGLGAYVWNDQQVRAISDAVRRVRGAHVVLGGPQVSFAPAGTLEQAYPSADLFVRGQGERAMVALALGADPETVRGVHVAGASDRNQRADAPLDELPSPYLTGVLEPRRFVRWETLRGCAYQCSFCQHREPGERWSRHELGEGRLRSELDLFRAGGVERIAVLDPIFHGRRDGGLPLLHHAREIGLTAELSLQCRFEGITDEFLDGLAGLNVRLEFGMQTLHADEAKAIHRPNNVQRIAAVIEKLHRRGIPFEVSLIYGLPLQTLESFRASVEWCLARRVPAVRAFPLMLLRGTPLEAERSRWGFVESGGPIPIVLSSDSFTAEEHDAMTAIADWLSASVYRHPDVLAGDVGRVLRGAA